MRIHPVLRTAVALTLLAGASGAARGAQVESIPCNPEGTQIELNACAREDYDQADAALNAAWRELLVALQGETVALQRLRQAQRAWIAFRDAEVAAHFPLAEGEDARVMYGSMYPMSMHALMTSLTEQRTAQLRARIEEIGPR